MSPPPHMRVEPITCEGEERKHDVFSQLIQLPFIIKKKDMSYYYIFFFFFSCFMEYIENKT